MTDQPKIIVVGNGPGVLGRGLGEFGVMQNALAFSEFAFVAALRSQRRKQRAKTLKLMALGRHSR